METQSILGLKAHIAYTEKLVSILNLLIWLERRVVHKFSVFASWYQVTHFQQLLKITDWLNYASQSLGCQCSLLTVQPSEMHQANNSSGSSSGIYNQRISMILSSLFTCELQPNSGQEYCDLYSGYPPGKIAVVIETLLILPKNKIFLKTQTFNLHLWVSHRSSPPSNVECEVLQVARVIIPDCRNTEKCVS